MISICIGLVPSPDLCLQRVRRDERRSPRAHLMPFHCSLWACANMQHMTLCCTGIGLLEAHGHRFVTGSHPGHPKDPSRGHDDGRAATHDAASDQARRACCRLHCVSLPLRHGPLEPLDTMTLFVHNKMFIWLNIVDVPTIYRRYVVDIKSIWGPVKSAISSR